MSLWIEKYRPNSFDEIIGQKDIVEKLKVMASKKEVQHMILSGPPGVGKTTSAITLAKAIYGDTWNENFIELNASDDRKLSVIQGKVKEFARSKPIDAPFKMILFDEADSLTQEAQQALRRMMEEYSQTCRFIFSVNFQSNLIEAIQSRCAIFRFQPLTKEDVYKFIDRISKGEGLEVTNEAKEALYTISKGDLRSLTNILQSISNVTKKIGKEDVYKGSGLINVQKLKEAVKDAMDGDYKTASEKVESILNEGVSIKEIMNNLFNIIIYDEKIEPKIKAYIIEKLAETDFRLIEGATPIIQLQAFIAFLSTIKR